MDKSSAHKNSKPRRHHFHSPVRRGLYSLFLLFSVLLLGSFGMHLLEGFSWLDGFYFTSMIATGQGPVSNIAPATAAGKIFTCLLAFISVGALVASLGFVFGPFMGRLWHIGIIKVEEELEHLHLKPKDKH